MERKFIKQKTLTNAEVEKRFALAMKSLLIELNVHRIEGDEELFIGFNDEGEFKMNGVKFTIGNYVI